MKKIQNFLEKHIMPIAGKLSANKYLQAIQNGLTCTMPMLMFGSICMIIVAFPINEYIMSESTIVALNDFFAHAYTIGMNLTALIVSFSIAYYLCKASDVEPIMGGFTGLFSFFMLIVFVSTEDGASAILLDDLAGQGLFLAILSSIVAGFLYVAFIKKGWTIKLPENVPPAISQSFMSMIPFVCVSTIFMLVRHAFELTSYGSALSFIYAILQIPLMNLGATLGSVMIAVFCCELCWFFGIHGGLIVMSVYQPILMALADQNTQAIAAGLAAPNVVNYNFYSVFFASLGGDAAFVCAAIVLTFLTKRKDLQDIGKLGLGSATFNITEPIVYGLPVVMNVYMFIPLCIGPMIEIAIAYFLTYIGFCPYAQYYMPWTCPPIISGWLTTGSWRGAVTQLIEMAVAFVLWYVAIKMYEKQLDKDNAQKDTVSEQQ